MAQQVFSPPEEEIGIKNSQQLARRKGMKIILPTCSMSRNFLNRENRQKLLHTTICFGVQQIGCRDTQPVGFCIFTKREQPLLLNPACLAASCIPAVSNTIRSMQLLFHSLLKTTTNCRLETLHHIQQHLFHPNPAVVFFPPFLSCNLKSSYEKQQASLIWLFG